MIRKILINIRQLQPRYTGVQSYIYNLTKSLIADHPSIQFDLATLNYSGGNKFIENLLLFPNANLVNTTKPNNAVWRILFDHIFISRIISNHDIYFNPVNITPVFKNRHTKYFVGVLDLCTFVVPQTTTTSLKIYYQLFLKRSLKSADHIIAISKNTKKDITELFGIDKDKIDVVYLGVDDQIMPLIETCSGGDYLFMMATSRRKNIEKSLRGYKIFHQHYPEVNVRILTNNREISRDIFSLTKKLGIKSGSVQTISSYTSKHNLSKLYQNATSFVYCPTYEGFGLPVLESMKCGCPVVTSNTSSLPEITNDAAILVDPESEHSIADALLKIRTTPKLRDKMIARGRANSKKYNWATSAATLFKIFLQNT